jgi:hypothetical protein
MPAPDALLLISTHCPHCPADARSSLAELLKQGAIGRLEAVNLEQHPEVGAGARRALGAVDCASAASNLPACTARAELAEWAAKADSEEGMADWFHMLLKEGQLPKVQAAIEAEPELLAAVLPIVGNVEASLNVRLGAGVLLEHFASSDATARAAGATRRTVAARRRAGARRCLPLPRACRRRGSAAQPWLQARLAR